MPPDGDSATYFPISRRVMIWGSVLLAVAGIAAIVMVLRPSALERARRAAAAGRLNEAAAFYEKHLRRHPDDYTAQMERGDLFQQEDPPRAVDIYGAVPATAAEHGAAQRRIAAAAIAAGNDGLAEKTLRKLAATSPDDFGVRLSLAELYHRNKVPKDALPHALRCAELQPGRVETWLLLAEIYDDLHRTHEMIVPLRRALELEPDLMDAHVNLCYALIWSGELVAGREEVEWCLARDPENVGARRMLAQCERDEGRPEDALREIRRALRTAPDDLECRMLEAQLLLFLRQPEEAYRRLHPLESRHGDNRRLMELLARAAAASNRPEEATVFRERAGRAAVPAIPGRNDE